MPRIEWQEEKTFEPPSALIEEFCAAKEIDIETMDNFRSPRVFVSENVLGTMEAHLESDMGREQGGVLIGQPFYDPCRERYFVDIHAAIPAYAATGTPAHLQFTAESWAYISPLIDRRFHGQVVVGWYHSHPGLGVFMSSTDRASQRAFYYHPWNMAVVFDPIAHEFGWFAGQECAPLEPFQITTYRELIAANEKEIESSAQFEMETQGRVREARHRSPGLFQYAVLFALSLVNVDIYFASRQRGSHK